MKVSSTWDHEPSLYAILELCISCAVCARLVTSEYVTMLLVYGTSATGATSHVMTVADYKKYLYTLRGVA